jgi:DNA invertase Pin-like site-specific DNA recombinase
LTFWTGTLIICPMDRIQSGRSKAAIYVRVSTADQHVENQLYDLRELAEKRGLEVVQIYRDCGISGRRARRPGLDALIADARRKKFATVLVAAFDRVGRSVRHFLQVMDEFDNLGIVFISRRENVDTSGPMGRLFLTLIGSIAELESDLIRERVLAGMRRAKLDGVRIGRAPMNLDRAAIVRDRLSGMTLTSVARKWGISRSLVCKLVNRSRAGHEGSALPTACVVDSVRVMQPTSEEARW